MSIFIKAADHCGNNKTGGLVPEGQYDAKLIEISERERFVVFIFKIDTPGLPYHGVEIKNFYGDHEIGYQLLNSDCIALGLPSPSPLSDPNNRSKLIGERVRIELKHRQKDGKTYSNIKILSTRQINAPSLFDVDMNF